MRTVGVNLDADPSPGCEFGQPDVPDDAGLAISLYPLACDGF